jgi:hypothetical protein
MIAESGKVATGLMTREQALQHLKELHALYVERHELSNTFVGEKVTASQRVAFKEQLPALREELNFALALYNDAVRAEESADSAKLQSTLKTWAIIVGVATLVQTLVAVAGFIKDL